MSRRLPAALFVLSVLAMVVAVWSGLRAQSYARCQARVNDALIAVQDQRADAADQDRLADRDESAATRLLIRTVFAATTREQSLAAYEAYDETLREIEARRAATEADRAAHPLPPPPSEVCA